MKSRVKVDIGLRVGSILVLVLAINTGPGKTSVSSIHKAATHQMKTNTRIEPTLRPTLTLTRDFIYSCASTTLKNSLTRSFSRSKSLGSSGYFHIGITLFRIPIPATMAAAKVIRIRNRVIPMWK